MSRIIKMPSFDNWSTERETEREGERETEGERLFFVHEVIAIDE
jgi:hypothetical protein